LMGCMYSIAHLPIILYHKSGERCLMVFAILSSRPLIIPEIAAGDRRLVYLKKPMDGDLMGEN